MQPIIEVQGLTKDFGRFRAVDGVSFSVFPGEIFGFLGPNGAGKSTTIRMLLGLLRPSGGTGRVAGYDLVREQARIKAKVGYMSQRFSLYEDLTAEENLEFFGGVYGLPEERLRTRIAEVLELVGLTERRRDLTRTLALGLRQRLALASAMLHEPPLLFLDEPTSGVDPVARRTFWDLIYHLASRGVTVLVTTHYLDEAEFCDRLILISQGRLIAQGTPRELKAQVTDRLLAVYPDPDRLAEALAAAREIPQATEVAVFGAGLHVAFPPAEQGEALLAQALAARGVKIRELKPVSPTLEDAFIALTRRASQTTP